MDIKKATLMLGIVSGAAVWASTGNAQDTIELRLAHGTSPESAYAQSTEFFAERLDELTDGRITVREFGGGALGSEATTLDLYATGDIDMGFHFTSNMASVVEKMGFFDVPFLFDSFEHWERTMLSEEAKEIMQGWLEEGGYAFSIAMVGLSGERNIYTKNTVIESMDDLQGFAIRVPESPVAARIWRTLGLSPTSVPWPDVYSALESGLVDGAENTPHWYYDSKHIEVAKHYHWTRHLYGTALVLIGNSTLERIPEDLRDEFQTAVDETEEFWTNFQVNADQETVDKYFGEYNVVQHEVPEELRNNIRETVAPLAEEIASELGTEGMLEYIRSKK